MDILVREGFSIEFLSLFASVLVHWIFLVIVIYICNEVSKDVSVLYSFVYCRRKINSYFLQANDFNYILYEFDVTKDIQLEKEVNNVFLNYVYSTLGL